MYKNLVLIVAMCVLLCASAYAQTGMSIWSLGGDKTAEMRFGYRFNKCTEAGISGAWNTGDEPVNQLWGIYATYCFDRQLEVPNPFASDWFPATVTAKPYMGAAMSLDLESQGEKRTIEPIIGLAFNHDEPVSFVLEYRYRFVSNDLEQVLSDESRFFFGAKIKF